MILDESDNNKFNEEMSSEAIESSSDEHEDQEKKA